MTSQLLVGADVLSWRDSTFYIQPVQKREFEQCLETGFGEFFSQILFVTTLCNTRSSTALQRSEEFILAESSVIDLKIKERKYSGRIIDLSIYTTKGENFK